MSRTIPRNICELNSLDKRSESCHNQLVNPINITLDQDIVHNAFQAHRQISVKPARRLVVVDIENLVGGPCLYEKQVSWAKSVLTHMLSLQPPDHIVVGISHVGLLPVGCNWPRIRYVVRSGPSGADLALLDVLNEDVSARFERVVVASGDGVFTDAVATLVRAGVSTTVLARPGTLAHSLRVAASHVLYVPEPPPEAGESSPAHGAASHPQLMSPRRHRTPRRIRRAAPPHPRNVSRKLRRSGGTTAGRKGGRSR